MTQSMDYSAPLSPAPPAIMRWLRMLAPLLSLACVVLLFALLSPRTFPTVGNFQFILKQTAVVGTAALGMTMIIVSGGIDLSVGSGLALLTVVLARFITAGMPPIAAALIAICGGAAIGLSIGLFVTLGRLIPFIVTLGMLGALRGAAKILAHESMVNASGTWLDELLNVFNPHNFLVPAGVWITLGLALIVSGVLRYTKFGRHIFAVGSNEQTARLCGVNVERTKTLVYVLAGALNGAAAVLLFSSQQGMGDPTGAVGYELNVIAAAVIGGASLAGGEGTVLGSLVGAVLMTVVANGCTKVGLPNPYQEIVTGGIILLAAALDRLRHRRAD